MSRLKKGTLWKLGVPRALHPSLIQARPCPYGERLLASQYSFNEWRVQ